MKKYLFIVLALFCLAFVSAALAADQEVVYFDLVEGDPVTLDPISAWTADSRKVVLQQVYERLAYYGEGDNLNPILAKDWSVSEDGKTYTVKLWEYIKDSQGNPFTADDVIWCITTQRDAGVLSQANQIESMEKIDDYTFSITFKSNKLGLFTALVVNAYLTTQEAYEADPEHMSIHAVGTGPYIVDEYEPGAFVRLVKNENYWQSPDLITDIHQYANADTIEMKVITETSQVVVALETGTVDIAFSDSLNGKKFLEGGALSDKFVSAVLSSWGGSDVWLNESDQSVFKNNVALCRAVMYSIDRPSIIEAVYSGYAENPTTYGSARYPDVDPSLTVDNYYGYDLAKAQAYLAEAVSAGFDPNTTIRLIYQSVARDIASAQVVQALLMMTGLKVELIQLDPAAWSAAMNNPGDWDITLRGKGGGWYVIDIWDSMLNRKVWNPDGNYAMGFINDDTLQELLETACSPDTHSFETVKAVHDYIMDQAYVQRMFVEQKIAVANNQKVVAIASDRDCKLVPGAFTYVWNQ